MKRPPSTLNLSQAQSDGIQANKQRVSLLCLLVIFTDHRIEMEAFQERQKAIMHTVSVDTAGS